MRICYQGEGLKMSEWIEQATRLGRENQKNLLRYGLSLVRQSVLHRVGVPVQARGDELAFVTRFSTQLTPKRAEDLAAELEKAIYHIERNARSEEHTSELQSLMRISYAVFCLKKKKKKINTKTQ